MAFDYDAMRNMADNLLSSANFGSTFTLLKPTGETTYNEETLMEEKEYAEYTGNCVKQTYTAEGIGEFANIIQAGDVIFVCTLDDETIEPTENEDIVVFNDIRYNVVKAYTVAPNGQKTIVYKMLTKRVR